MNVTVVEREAILGFRVLVSQRFDEGSLHGLCCSLSYFGTRSLEMLEMFIVSRSIGESPLVFFEKLSYEMPCDLIIFVWARMRINILSKLPHDIFD